MARKHRMLLPAFAAIMTTIVMVPMASGDAHEVAPADPLLLSAGTLIDSFREFEATHGARVALRPWDAEMDKRLTATTPAARVVIEEPVPVAEGDAAPEDFARLNGQGRDDTGEFKKLGSDFNGVPVKTLLRDLGNALQRPEAEIECLAYALYFEARGESVNGQKAVANVILNRRESRYYPDTICGVIHQGGYDMYECQFTYRCDGIEETIHEVKVYYAIKRLAHEILSSKIRVDKTHGATHYHTVNVRPDWATNQKSTTRIGNHIFYKI